jgi:hypothetical protein
MKKFLLLICIYTFVFAGGRKPPPDQTSPGYMVCGGKNNCVCAIYPGESAVVSYAEEANFKWQFAETASWYEIWLDGALLVTVRPGTNTYNAGFCYIAGTSHSWYANAFGGNGICNGKSAIAHFRITNPK